MKGAEARLEMFIKIIVRKMLLNLCGYSFFQNFGKKRKVRDGTKMVQICRVRSRLLKNRSNNGCFKNRWNRSRENERVDNRSDEGRGEGQIGFNQRSRKRIKMASRCFCFMDEGGDFINSWKFKI